MPKSCQKGSKAKIILIIFPYTLGQVGDYTLGFYSYLDLIPISHCQYASSVYFYGGLISYVFAYVYCENCAKPC